VAWSFLSDRGENAKYLVDGRSYMSRVASVRLRPCNPLPPPSIWPLTSANSPYPLVSPGNPKGYLHQFFPSSTDPVALSSSGLIGEVLVDKL